MAVAEVIARSGALAKWTRSFVATPVGQSAVHAAASALALLGFGCETPPAEQPEKKRSLPVIPPTTSVSASLDPAPPPAATGPAKLTITQRASHDWVCARATADPHRALRAAIAAVPPSATAPDREAALEKVASEATSLPDSIEKLVVGDLMTQDELLRALDSLEIDGVFDQLFASLAFRRTRALTRGELAPVLARIDRYARISVALQRAVATTGPAVFTVWRSKAGRPTGVDPCTVPEGFHEKVALELRAADSGTWVRDAMLMLDVVGDTPAIVVSGGRDTKKLVELSVTRLDVLRGDGAAVTVKHSVLGSFEIPAGTGFSTWNARAFLSAEATDRVRDQVKRAARGDVDARAELEHTLFASWSFIQEELDERPNSKGAPALRMLLALFYE